MVIVINTVAQPPLRDSLISIRQNVKFQDIRHVIRRTLRHIEKLESKIVLLEEKEKLSNKDIPATADPVG